MNVLLCNNYTQYILNPSWTEITETWQGKSADFLFNSTDCIHIGSSLDFPVQACRKFSSSKTLDGRIIVELCTGSCWSILKTVGRCMKLASLKAVRESRSCQKLSVHTIHDKIHRWNKGNNRDLTWNFRNWNLKFTNYLLCTYFLTWKFTNHDTSLFVNWSY